MNGNAELLNFIYQNSQMGVDTLEQLIPMTEEENFKERLEMQYKGYGAFHNEAANMLNVRGYDEKGLSAFEKIRTYLMINMQTLTDTSASHIAEMLIFGSNMGIVDAIKKVRQYKGDVEPDILALMERLKYFEENNVEQLKAFL